MASGTPPTTKMLAWMFRKARVERGLTQRAAADLLGVTSVHLCNIERSHGDPSLAFLKRACYLYKRDLWTEAKEQGA